MYDVNPHIDRPMSIMLDDIPQHTELRVVVEEQGEDSYVEYDREDGSVRRVVTQKGGEVRTRITWERGLGNIRYGSLLQSGSDGRVGHRSTF